MSPDAPAVLTALLATSSSAEERDAAWAEFVEQFSAVLLRTCRRFDPGHDAAMDRYAYVLESLRADDCRRLRAFRNDGRASFTTWLAVTAGRLSVDFHRRAYGRPVREASAPAHAERLTRRVLKDLDGGDAGILEVADAGPSPELELIARLRQERLADAIAALPPDDQLVLRLRFEDDLSAREIAGRSGLPTPFHVYRRLRAICDRLRASLGRGPEDF
jgi:RNA polymerase sigma factor (sigma-70 family)